MSTQHKVESTQGRSGSISWSQTRYILFNRMVTQHWVESSLWSRTKWSHSPKRRALDAAQKNQHSLSAREAFSSIPSLSRKYTNFDVVRGLVKISAICLSVWMYCNFRAPLYTRYLRKWYLISMCFDLSWNTGFSESFMQLWLSQWMIVESSFPWTDWIKVFWANCFLAGITCSNILCSAIFWAMEPCFLLDQEIIAYPILKQ